MVAALTDALCTPIVCVAILTCVLFRYLLGPNHNKLPSKHYETPRRFLLTGCASGMGRRLTKRLLTAGHSVVATDVKMGELSAVSDADGWEDLDGAVMLKGLDVRKPEDWSSVLATVGNAWGGLDTVINFAGLLIPKSALEVTSAEIDAHVDVMVKGVMHGTAAAAKAFLTQRVQPPHEHQPLGRKPSSQHPCIKAWTTKLAVTQSTSLHLVPLLPSLASPVSSRSGLPHFLLRPQRISR